MIITCNDIPVISLVLLLLAMGHKLVKILYKLITKFYKTAQNFEKEKIAVGSIKTHTKKQSLHYLFIILVFYIG